MMLSMIFTILTFALSIILVYMAFNTNQVNIGVFMICYVVLSLIALAEQIYTTLKIRNM